MRDHPVTFQTNRTPTHPETLMQIPAFHHRSPLSRRHFLRSSSAVTLGLPWLEAMGPSLGQRVLAATPSNESPKRFVAICATLGFHAPFLFPDQEGDDLGKTPYLAKLQDHLDQLTLFSGLSHPEQQGNNGHASELTWLTSAQRPGLAGFRNSVSLDQVIANKVGTQTRFPYLALSTSGRSMSWTSGGVEIPGMASPAKLFKSLFIEGTEAETDQEVRKLKRGLSILDSVQARAKELEQGLGHHDRHKMEQYLDAVRDLEFRLQQSQGWVQRPKPPVDSKQPQDIADKSEAIQRQRLLYDLAVLALQTDSTRTITYNLSGMNAVPKIKGVQSDWHGLSHHGKDPKKINELKLVEEAEFVAFNEFLTKLRSVNDNGQSLLDHTAVLFGSNLGNASAHDWHNLPIIVAGGGYQHGAYVAHDPKDNTPLANLFVPLAQRMGVELDQFGTSTSGSLRGLESSS